MMTWQYVAGFMDGEGNVGIASNHGYGYSPRVALAQSGDIGIKVLLAIQKFLSENGIEAAFRTEQPRKLSKLPIHKLTLTSRKNVTSFLENTLPYLITKRVESEDTLRHLKLFPALPRGGKLSWEGRRAKQKENVLNA